MLGALCAFARVIISPILLLISELGVLCPVEYSHSRGVSVALVTVFHGESYLSSDSLNPNSTENFKYLWIVVVYHEVHEDHEEFHNLITLCVLRALRGDIFLSL